MMLSYNNPDVIAMLFFSHMWFFFDEKKRSMFYSFEPKKSENIDSRNQVWVFILHSTLLGFKENKYK